MLPMTKMRLALLPLMVSALSPGPTMVVGRVIERAPMESVMSWLPEGNWNWIVSLLPSVPETSAFSPDVNARPSVPSTTWIASRNVSALLAVTLSATLLTVSTAGAQRSSSGSSAGRKRGLVKAFSDRDQRSSDLNTVQTPGVLACLEQATESANGSNDVLLFLVAQVGEERQADEARPFRARHR